VNDRELLKEFIRVERTESRVRIRIRKIHWDGPGTPVSTWEIAKSLSGTASASAIEKATAGILQDHRYFLTCDECGGRKPVGWMLNESICQGCAETNHGVVF
jgi:hypothetical protein